jgi:hypothetical protein
VVITSRPQIPMKSYFPDLVNIPLDSNTQNGIVKYVQGSVLGLKKRNIPIELRQEIQGALIRGSNGMFLWVYLILYDLKTSSRTSQHAIQNKLKTLPRSLPDLYEKILLAIHPDDLELANSILRWVVWAERPLTLEELKIAIAIQPGHRSMSDLSRMVENDFEGVLRLILGAIIRVQDDTVYLVHQSAKEFLREINPFKGERFPSLPSNESNLDITISCLTYLSFDEFDNPELLEQPEWQLKQGYPFFNYSSSYLSDHMKQLDDEVQ